MTLRRFTSLPVWLLILASGLWITSCSRQTDEPTAEPTAKSTSTPAMTKPEKKLLAEWRSFSYSPPRYAVEAVLIYDDFSCVVAEAANKTRSPCSWKRADGDGLLIDFPNQSKVTAKLNPPLSNAGKKQPDTAGYLVISLDENRRQLFVLAGSEDDKMVVDTVRGENHWEQRRYREAVKELRNALAKGSVYARLRLAWIYSTTTEFHLPAVALKLLHPLRVNNNSYGVVDSFAAAYAANGQFDKAVIAGERACELAPKPEVSACLTRLSGFKAGQAVVTALPPPETGKAVPAKP